MDLQEFHIHLLLPHRFWSIEYGLAKLIGTGISFSCAYSISSSRDHFHSRTGARTSKSGFNALMETSKRTWSLPFPVQPCATATAFSSSATSPIFLKLVGVKELILVDIFLHIKCVLEEKSMHIHLQIHLLHQLHMS